MVGEERRHIFKTIMEIGSTPIQIPPGYSDTCKFFSTSNELSQPKENEITVNDGLVVHLNTLLNSYPKFDASIAKDPGYVRGIHQEIEEHHTKVMMIFNECLRLIDVADHEREYLFNM